MPTKQKITYCLWLVKQVEEAVNFYTTVFPEAKSTCIDPNPVDTPSGKAGTVLTASFDLAGQSFLLLNGGTQFKLNPSVSFMINCDTAEEVETCWNKLSDGGKALMPLDKYPFSDKYGWIEDKYGVSWQLILPQSKAPQKVVPVLMFVNEVYGKAEEAISYYTSLFNQAKKGTVILYPPGMEPDKEGTVMFADFTLENEWFAAMDSVHAHPFQFNQAISFMVNCDTQEEIDHYWNKLTQDGKAVQCGWLNDKYGIAWQIVPTILSELMQSKEKGKSKRVMEALMKMVKLDIAALAEA